MPFTPFHWGLPLFTSDLLFSTNRTTHIRSSIIGLILVTIPDLEGFLHLIIGIDSILLHGPLHSYFGAVILGALAVLIIRLSEQRAILPTSWELPRRELWFYFLTPFLYHIIPDLMVYPDMRPGWPFVLDLNTIPSSATRWLSSTICVYTTVLFPVYLLAKQVWKSYQYGSTK